MRRKEFMLLVASGAAQLLAACGGGRDDPGFASFAVSPDGKRVAFSGLDGDLYLFDLATKSVTSLTSTPELEYQPSFSPDGKSLVLARMRTHEEGARLFILPIDGGAPRPLTSDTGVSDAMPAYSRDGSLMSFTRSYLYRSRSMGGMTWSHNDICVVKPDGSGLKRLTHEDYYGAGPSHITPDGRSVLYTATVPYDTEFFGRNSGGSMETLLHVPTDGSGKPRLVAPLTPGEKYGALAKDIGVSPDGRMLAFISDRLGSGADGKFRWEIYTARTDLTGEKAVGVTSSMSYNESPRFLPGTDDLLFLSGWPDAELWRVNAKTGKSGRIAGSELFTNPRGYRP